MQSPADNHGSGLDASRQAAPVIPLKKNDQAALPGKPEGDSLQRRLKRRSALERRQRIAEYLFSEDARKQYIAMKALESATAISGAQYVRIQEIRCATPHLAIAEVAQGILREKATPSTVLTETRQEVMALIQECEQQQRQRLLKASQEIPVVSFARGTVARWLVCTGLAGFALGCLLTYAVVPRGGAPARPRRKPTLILARDAWSP